MKKTVKRPENKPTKSEPFIEESIAEVNEKPSGFFREAWANDPTRTAKSIREAA